MTPDEKKQMDRKIQERRDQVSYAHLGRVAARLRERYGQLPFYIERERKEGSAFWRQLAGSAWNLDGLWDGVLASEAGKLFPLRQRGNT